MGWRRIRVLLFTLLVGLGVLPLAGAVANAQEEDFSFAPDFYHVVEQPGKQFRTRLNLENHTGAPLIVLVDFVDTPGDPWRPQIRGEFSSFGVREVLVPPMVTAEDEPVILSLVIDLPEEAPAGDYPFTLRARTADGRLERSFTVTVTVEEQKEVDGDQVELESRFPFLQGPTASEFEFKVTLRNRSSDPITLDLGALAPQGWAVTFKPSFEEKLITSVSLDGNQNQIINVLVKPPRAAEPRADPYPIQFIATSDDTQLTTNFGIVITGTQEVRLGTSTGRLNAKATAGKDTLLSLLVLSTGTGVVPELNFFSAAPSGWEVTFEPKRIENLQPDEIREVVARLTPPEDAIPGDYSVTVRATSLETSERLDLRIAVTQATIWGWVGLAIVVLVIGGLVGLFVKLGRR